MMSFMDTAKPGSKNVRLKKKLKKEKRASVLTAIIPWKLQICCHLLQTVYIEGNSHELLTFTVQPEPHRNSSTMLKQQIHDRNSN